MSTDVSPAVALAAPEVDTDLKPIKAAVLALAADMAGVDSIRSEADLEAVCTALVRLQKGAVKPAEAVRKHLNEPLATAKERNDRLIRDTLTADEGVYMPDLADEWRAAICKFSARQYVKRAREAQRELERLATASEKAEAAGMDVPVLPFVPGIASPKRTIKTPDGSVSIGAKLKATVLDESKLDARYFTRVPNMKLIEAEFEAGREVPGAVAELVLNTTVR